MTGIAALWNLDGAPPDAALLGRMSAMLGAPEAACRLGADAGVAAAVTDVDLLPLQGPRVGAGGEVLAFDGRLDERDDLCRWTGAAPDASDAALVLAAYRRAGERFLGRLHGDFALVLHDPAARRMILARDVIGPRPLVYARVGASFLVASEAKAFLAHPRFRPRPDLHHLAEYLIGAPPAADAGITFLEGVTAVRPGWVVVLTPAGPQVQPARDFGTASLRMASGEEYREEFRRRFDRAVARRLRGVHPVVVSVSGGVDSSAVFCTALALAARGNAPGHAEGLTEAHPGDPRADETGFIREIEERFGVAVHRRPGGGTGTLESWARQVWHAEVPDLHPFAEAVEDRTRFARGIGARLLMGGEWADAVVFDQAYLVDLVRRGAWRTARAHLAAIPAWFQDADPRPFRRQFLRDLVRFTLPQSLLRPARSWRAARDQEAALFARGAALREFPRGRPEDAAAGHGLPTLHARSLYARVRSRRAALDLGAASRYSNLAGLRYALPYMDFDLLDFLIRIPGEAVTPAGVPKGLLREAMRGRMPDSIVERRWKADFTHLVQSGLKRYSVTLSAYLRTHTAAVDLGLVDGSTLRRLLDAWSAEGEDTGSFRFWSILRVLGLELWLQAFLAAPPPGGAHASAPPSQ